MRRWVLGVVICAIGVAPIAGRAAEKPLLVQSTPAAVVVGFDETQILAIGAGVVIGAAAGSLLSLRGATLVGGLAGGAIGAWWYGAHPDIAPLDPRKK